MSEEPFPLLLCTNGNEQTRPSLETGVWLASQINHPVTLLGIVEAPMEKPLVTQMVEFTERLMKDAGISYETIWDSGRGSVAIGRHACDRDVLTVVGPLGRPTWRRVVQGRSVRRILEKVCSPVLYVRCRIDRLKKILVCLGGLQYSGAVENLCLYLAGFTGASLTLLHIVEPVTLQYPISTEIHDHWQHILETHTPQGTNLRKAMKSALETGLSVEFKVRHGNAIHEIIEEVKTGGYDLVGMGSSYSSHSLRHLYVPNVTAEVAEGVQCPILVVRQGHALITES